ncbi:nuclear transport factor 2 family protein [Streptacidiphilus carbonis]|uniref:nuclear transport factor 2 family protein n=1 Tax=Streptacidiphilus carbonis TaxID=105422 RepID=UPI0005A9D869|nr:nuclear transport factor 2 family protein [Streptacidiphilus carbonis]
MKAAPVTARLRAALSQVDLLPLSPLLHPDVHWVGREAGQPDCRGRAEVLARLAALHQPGGRVAVEETFTYPDAVVLGIGLIPEGPPKDDSGQGSPTSLYTVFHLTGGLITRIHGHGDRCTALDAAYSASIHPHPAPPPAAGTHAEGPTRRGAV